MKLFGKHKRIRPSHCYKWLGRLVYDTKASNAIVSDDVRGCNSAILNAAHLEQCFNDVIVHAGNCKEQHILRTGSL